MKKALLAIAVMGALALMTAPAMAGGYGYPVRRGYPAHGGHHARHHHHHHFRPAPYCPPVRHPHHGYRSYYRAGYGYGHGFGYGYGNPRGHVGVRTPNFGFHLGW